MNPIFPQRAPEDLISGVARVVLGGQTYVLPPLFWDKSDEWLASMDKQVSALLGALDKASADTSQIIAVLQSKPGDLLDALYAYDRTNVLPERSVLLGQVTKNEVVYAVMGVWRAANPLVDAAVGLMLNGSLMDGILSVLLNTQPQPTDSEPEVRPSSDDDGPSSSSSPSRTPPRNGGPSSSRTPSKRPASATSSPKASTARSSTNGGVPGTAIPMPRPAPVAQG